MSDQTRFNMDKGIYTEMMILSFYKRFGTINHQILLSKLAYVGLNKESVNWVR